MKVSADFKDFLKLLNERLEVSTDIDGVTFDECYANRVVVTVDDISITLIGYEDLLTNKRAAGRLKDLLDVEELEERNR